MICEWYREFTTEKEGDVLKKYKMESNRSRALILIDIEAGLDVASGADSVHLPGLGYAQTEISPGLFGWTEREVESEIIMYSRSSTNLHSVTDVCDLGCCH